MSAPRYLVKYEEGLNDLRGDNASEGVDDFLVAGFYSVFDLRENRVVALVHSMGDLDKLGIKA